MFLDSNIIIGFSIEVDPWNYYSKRIFEIDKPKFYSTTVKAESKVKIRDLLFQYNLFFYLIKRDIPKDYITENEFLKIVTQIKHINGKEFSFDQENIAGMIWSEGAWFKEANSLEIFKLLDDILDDINETTFPNFKKCIASMNLHERKNSYLGLLNYLKTLKKEHHGETIMIHHPDDEIILDAHDLASSKGIDLFFISSDKKLLRFSEEIKNITSITDMFSAEDAFFRVN